MSSKLDTAIEGIHKQFGTGSLIRMDEAARTPIPHISTGITGLDLALGVGGLPKGRVVEIHGPEASGKTTITLQVIAQAQKEGMTCAFVDAEHALDPIYAESLGVQLDKLLVSQPDCGEQGLEITDMLARTGEVGLIVIDSVAALTPKAEIDGQMGDHHLGLQARLMSQALRKLTASVSKGGTIVIFINQLRQKIGVTFGSKETTPGGNALKFYCSVRLDVRRIGGVKDGDLSVGNKIRVRVVKNKVAPPFRQVELEIIFGKGISAPLDLLDRGVVAGLIEQRGSYYRIGERTLGQGRTTAAKSIEDDPALMSSLRSELMELGFGALRGGAKAAA